ncbi:MAG: hypothetical protein R3B70_10280 [Polyangiaceae bacterium]
MSRGAATEARNAAYDAAAVSTALFIAGGVLAAGGAALVIAVPSRSEKPAGAVAVRVGPLGVSVGGSF